MDQQHAIDRGIGQRQFRLVDQRREPGPVRRPFHHALRGRHEGQATLRILAENPEIRGGVADTGDPLAAHLVPMRADAVADKAPGHDPERLRVEIPQVHDVDEHGQHGSMKRGIRPRIRRRGRILQAALPC